MSKKYPKDRLPAQVVSCPHCDWKGSARGLYTHCRMGHPNKSLPETKGKRVWQTIHPQAEKPVNKPKKSLSKQARMIKEELRLLDLLELYIKNLMMANVVSANEGYPVLRQLGCIPNNTYHGDEIEKIDEKSFRARE
jgi:hypothetical protein